MSGEHEDLVGAAAGLLAQGSGVPTPEEIAEVAGVPVATVGDGTAVLAEALLVHVGSTMNSTPGLPPAGEGTVEENLGMFIAAGCEVLGQVAPAFARLAARPDVLARFHAMVGGDAAFGAPAGDSRGVEGRGLPDLLSGYLRAEQELGRVPADADVPAVVSLVVGAIHGQILPPVLFNPGTPVRPSADLAARLAAVVVRGLAR
ncbi:MAG TPA: hypothetical protein VHV74_07250 [Pseudonocardiaceae bacterium]|jgi:hypothetical protein|nr:hypothetical protein [Pseudonocardiaceae bacterium]